MSSCGRSEAQDDPCRAEAHEKPPKQSPPGPKLSKAKLYQRPRLPAVAPCMHPGNIVSFHSELSISGHRISHVRWLELRLRVPERNSSDRVDMSYRISVTCDLETPLCVHGPRKGNLRMPWPSVRSQCPSLSCPVEPSISPEFCHKIEA